MIRPRVRSRKYQEDQPVADKEVGRMRMGATAATRKVPKPKPRLESVMAARFRFHFVFSLFDMLHFVFEKGFIARHARHGTRSA